MLKIVKHASQMVLDLGFVRPILWSCFKSRSYATQESGTISDCYSDEKELKKEIVVFSSLSTSLPPRKQNKKPISGREAL